MSYRNRLLMVFGATVLAAVVLVVWGTSALTRRAFAQAERERTDALVEQVRHEFARRGEEVAKRVQGIADADATLRMAVGLAGQAPDYSLYVNEARDIAAARQLDLLEIVAGDGRIISSAHWPARFGYRNPWVTQTAEWEKIPAFLQREELVRGATLALLAVRVVRVGGKNLYIIGGQRLDREFLASLALPAGMRALLYRDVEPGFSLQSLNDASGSLAQGEKLAGLVERVRREGKEQSQTVNWSGDAADAETFYAQPLRGRGQEMLGLLLVGNSQRGVVLLGRRMRWFGAGAGGIGLLLGLALAAWLSSRITRPVEQLAAGARAVAAGDWQARVEADSNDEIGELGRAFNQMTRQLAEHRERLVQSERVAAWRELARRLAHELKNPLFPLQITVENLQRARERAPQQFDEVFRESTATLLAELRNMTAIIGRFSDFAKMPAPHLEAVSVNDLLRDSVRLFEPQFAGAGRPPIRAEFALDTEVGNIPADPVLLRRAFENLVLNTLDAMPEGGTLTVRTRRSGASVHIEFADSGVGLKPEERERLFTPYYTTKEHGTGLGLAIVQSVISDHGGRISVASEAGQGTTFHIELPAVVPAAVTRAGA
jgi:two-component system nitrogen regulation sensor histidine kinase NtrY